VLKWTEPNEPELIKFLVERMQFNEERVMGGLKRLKAARGSSSQQRMDSFFKVHRLRCAAAVVVVVVTTTVLVVGCWEIAKYLRRLRRGDEV